LSRKGINTPVVRLGWPDQYIEHASSVDHLREKYGLTAARIVEDVKQHLAAPAKRQLVAQLG
jgi:1-deoxy-D-xylulose-5-phosphate synthase